MEREELTDKVGLTRRELLQRIGIAGGAAALYDSAVAMGLLQVPAMTAEAAPNAGNGKTVLVLGAATGGLTLAWALHKAGFSVKVLEAQDHVGGRTWTARPGTKVVEGGFDGIPRTEQVCKFAEGLSLNLGAGRIPYHHRRVLQHCHELKVVLEPYIMTTTANLYQKNGTVAQRATPRRVLQYDTQGQLAALLVQAVDGGFLPKDLDLAQLKSLLQVFGDLDPATLAYRGSTRTGCASGPSVLDACQAGRPLPLSELLASGFWKNRFYQPDDFLWQPTLFQPTGGMDKIAMAFQAHLDMGQQRVFTGREAKAVKLEADGVSVTVLDLKSGETTTERADYCVSSIPLPVLNTMNLQGFQDDFRKAIAACKFEEACKVGWQVNRRFWEDDSYQIYGGISYIDHEIVQFWYPSDGFFGPNGTVTGAYNYGETAKKFGELDLGARLEKAREGAIRLHPQFADPRLAPEELGMSIAWQNIPYQRGGWSAWKQDQNRDYLRLLFPDGNFFVVGDQMSTLPGWQEGAMMSAEWVLGKMRQRIDGVESFDVPASIRLPDVEALTRGLGDD